MSVLVRKLLFAGLATTAVSLVQMSSVSASDDSDIQSQCQHQADEYGIEPEQRDDYINGCILSMGGTLDEDQSLETEGEDTPEIMESPEAEEIDAIQ